MCIRDRVGASRYKNAVSSAVKNLLAFAFMIPTFWLFGWYIYLAFPMGFSPIDLEGYGTPWNVSMGPMLSDQATGVFWAAFTLFASTTASFILFLFTLGIILISVLLAS